MIIPAGKKVRFYTANFKRKLVNTDLILNEDINLNISSSFAPLADNAGKTGTILSQISKEFLGLSIGSGFKEMGFQLFEKSEPIALSFTASLQYKTDAYTDTTTPARELLKLPLPSVDPVTKNFITPGPSIVSLFKKNAQTGELFSLKIGGLRLNPVIITSVEPVMKTEIDDTNGFINMTLKFDVKTLYSATREMIDDMFTEVNEF